MIKNVIFDFDGTIANTEALAYHIYELIVSEYEIKKLSRDEFEDLKKVSIYEKFKRHQVSLFKLPKLASKAIRILSHMMDEVDPYQGMIDTLKALKSHGLNLFIVSSNSKNNIKKFLERHDLHVFTAIFGRARYFGKEKILTKLLKKYDLEGHQTVYIGDEVRDVVSCKNVGIPIYSVSWGFDDPEFLEKENEGSVVDSAEQLKSLLIV